MNDDVAKVDDHPHGRGSRLVSARADAGLLGEFAHFLADRARI